MSKVNFTARTAMVNAISTALDGVGSTGALMTDIADTARKHYKGEEIPKDDVESIASSVAESQGWNAAARIARTSEIRVILRACAKLPAYLKAATEKMDSFTWHDAMKLARRVNAGDSIPAAVAFVRGTKKAPHTSVNPKGRAVGALSLLFDSVKGERRDTVRKALKMLRDAGIVNVSPALAEKVGL